MWRHLPTFVCLIVCLFVFLFVCLFCFVLFFGRNHQKKAKQNKNKKKKKNKAKQNKTNKKKNKEKTLLLCTWNFCVCYNSHFILITSKKLRQYCIFLANIFLNGLFSVKTRKFPVFLTLTLSKCHCDVLMW